MNTDILQFDRVSFGYDTRLILKEINLTVKQGQCYCLMGRNGCGKSTLMNCLLKKNADIQGNISIYGKNIKEFSAKELSQKMAFVPQNHQTAFPYLVKQVVLMGRTPQLSGFNGPANEDMELVMETLDKLGILHLAGRPYTQISGGELKLVMLARALVQETQMILMDEPTAHLDFYNELLFLEKIAELMNQEKKTILMATHSPNQAFQLEAAGVFVQIGLMKDGQILAEGSPAEVLNVKNMEQIFGIKGAVLEYERQKILIPQQTIGR